MLSHPTSDFLPLPHAGQAQREPRELQKLVARFLAVISRNTEAAQPGRGNGLREREGHLSLLTTHVPTFQ